MSTNIYTEYMDEVVCPHCGYKHSGSWKMFESGCEDVTTQCDECGKDFCAIIHHRTTYSTMKARSAAAIEALQ